MLHFVAVLDLVDEDLSRLEAGDVMFIDNDGSIARDIPGNFLFSLLVDEAAEATDVNILTTRHVLLHYRKESLYRSGNICLVDARFFCDLINNVCLGHGCKRLKGEWKFQVAKVNRRMINRKMNLLIITTMWRGSRSMYGPFVDWLKFLTFAVTTHIYSEREGICAQIDTMV